jgi:hypothetical protein
MASAEGIEWKQTLLARGGQTKSGALDRDWLINA